MPKTIELLNSGQAPTLLSASKGNELIRAINGLVQSKASEKASSIGLRLIVEEDGKLVLDATNELASTLEKTIQSGGGGLPEGFEEETLTVVINGQRTTRTFLTKS
jgi:hypothetical protein